MSNKTFTMIKPDAVANGYAGGIISKIIEAGFRISAMKLTALSPERASQFYAVHKAYVFGPHYCRYPGKGKCRK